MYNVIYNKGGEIMKEAAGEANMTVITIVLIGIVLAIGGVLITSMMNNTKDRANSTSGAASCNSNQYWNGKACVNTQ